MGRDAGMGRFTLLDAQKLRAAWSPPAELCQVNPSRLTQSPEEGVLWVCRLGHLCAPLWFGFPQPQGEASLGMSQLPVLLVTGEQGDRPSHCVLSGFLSESLPSAEHQPLALTAILQLSVVQKFQPCPWQGQRLRSG